MFANGELQSLAVELEAAQKLKKLGVADSALVEMKRRLERDPAKYSSASQLYVEEAVELAKTEGIRLKRRRLKLH